MHRDDLFLEFVRVVERAAIAAARTMGQGDRKYSDQVAVESMRKEMESVDSDGNLSAGISAAVVGTGVHAVMGTGGAPEGVLTAAAMRCLNGEIQGRLVLTKPADKERLKKMGITNLEKVYRTEDLAPGPSVIFAAAGVTDGALLKGVRFFGDGLRTHTLVMTTVPHQVRFIDTIHAKDDPDVK